ncbi:cell division protein PerM [Rhodococcus sp. UNC363MFTsu5.1]|uniref:cell division protein PerM n=1 Tax=Rhodococcus sp. UNC363MFTsu5.1 TaxID=1449069 RepID=UPI001E64F667|nr:DUF6350 family protein [Rhodococcus sp. UNC363MFTsu5.1]
MSSLRSSDTLRRPSRRRTPAAPRPTPNPEQVRTLLAVALRPALVALALIAACILVTLVAANSDLTGTSGAVAASWLAVHQVQLTIGGASLGVLPLVPTILMIWSVARGCAHAVTEQTPRHEQLWVLGAALAGPLLVTALALAVIKDASSVIALAPPNALAAFAWVLGVHLIGAGIGMGSKLWRPICARLGVPEWVRASARPALRAGLALLASGAALTAVALISSWAEVGELLEAGDGFGGALGLTLLSILYLPNLAVGSAAMLVGSTAHIGEASLSVFTVVGGPLPALPLLGAVPAGPSGGGWPALLLIPAVLGVQLGRDCAHRAGGPSVAVRKVLVAAAAAALALGLLGFAAGGELGSFGTVGVDLAMFTGLSFAWLAVFGSLTALVVARREGGGQERERSKPADQPEPPRTYTLAARMLDRPEPPPVKELPEASYIEGEVVVEAEVVDSGGDPAAQAGDHGVDATDAVDAEIDDAVVDAEVADVTSDPAEADLPEGTRTSSD